MPARHQRAGLLLLHLCLERHSELRPVQPHRPLHRAPCGGGPLESSGFGPRSFEILIDLEEVLDFLEVVLGMSPRSLSPSEYGSPVGTASTFSSATPRSTR